MEPEECVDCGELLWAVQMLGAVGGWWERVGDADGLVHEGRGDGLGGVDEE